MAPKLKRGQGIVSQFLTLGFAGAVLYMLVAGSWWSFIQTADFMSFFPQTIVFGVTLRYIFSVIFQYGQGGFLYAARTSKEQAQTLRKNKTALARSAKAGNKNSMSVVEIDSDIKRLELMTKVWLFAFRFTLGVDIGTNVGQFIFEFDVNTFVDNFTMPAEGLVVTIIKILGWVIGILIVIFIAAFEEIIPIFVIWFGTAFNDILEHFGIRRIEAIDTVIDYTKENTNIGAYTYKKPKKPKKARTSIFKKTHEPTTQTFRSAPKSQAGFDRNQFFSDSDDEEFDEVFDEVFSAKPTYHNLNKPAPVKQATFADIEEKARKREF